MKVILGITTAALILTGCATVPKGEPMLSYQRIVELPNVKQDVIFEGSRQWIAKNFKSANSVIQYQDKASGSVIGKGNISFPCIGAMSCMRATNPVLEFTLKIDAKDDKVRVSFSDLNIHNPSGYNAIVGAVSASNNAVHSDEEKKQAQSILDKAINGLSQDILKTGTDNW